MSREIEFRVWDTVMRSWVPMGLNEISELVFMEKSDIDGGFVIDTFDSKSDRFAVMQYTGLKDKKGVKIFEGDIMDWNCELFRIGYHEASFSFINTAGEWDGYLMLQGSDRIEVVGNIHQHPKLLETQK